MNILAVAIGRGASVSELRGMVSSPVDQNIHVAVDWDSLNEDIITEVQNSVCDSECFVTLNPSVQIKSVQTNRAIQNSEFTRVDLI